MKRFSLFFLVAFSLNAHAEPLKIMTYSSFVGVGTLGEWLGQQEPCTHGRCTFIHPHPSRSLFEEIRYRAEKKLPQPDIILGLDDLQLKWAQDDKLVASNPVPTGESPLVLLFKESALKNVPTDLSWKDLPARFKNQIVLQDPRFSALSQIVLAFGKSTGVLSPSDLKALTKRVFPKWSASYRYFTENDTPVLLTFATTLAYHVCQKKGPAMAILNLKEGFPLYREWAARVLPPRKEQSTLADGLFQTLRSKEFQKQVLERNWLLPSNSQVPVPDCYNAAAKLKVTPYTAPTRPEFQSWIDQWSL